MARATKEETRRWQYAPPIQDRSRETAERFVAATERLLARGSFERISIQDIAREADRSTGSFYARFASKEALLPLLYERYDRDLRERFARAFRDLDWASLPFEDAAARLVDYLVGTYVERRFLIRALALFVRTHPEALPEEIFRGRAATYDRVVAAFRPHRARIRHADTDTAVRFGIFLVSSAAREKLLFDNAPLARVTPLERTRLAAELTRALIGYLTVAPAGDGAPRARRSMGGRT